jgi:hypothetical protein
MQYRRGMVIKNYRLIGRVLRGRDIKKLLEEPIPQACEASQISAVNLQKTEKEGAVSPLTRSTMK